MSDLPVIVIGGGPAGIGAAVELRHSGIAQVIILEREANAGGVPRHCGHPPFGMREFGRIYTGPAYAARLVQRALAAGVEIRTNTTVVSLEPGGRLQIVDRNGRAMLTGSRVVLATGARETPRSARLTSGARPLGVLNTGALQNYVYLRNLVPFRRPLIVGTELVSFSAILTCLKASIKPAGMIEAGSRPVAWHPAGLLPRFAGVKLHYDTEIETILGSGRVEGVTVCGPAGRQHIACDGVLFTGKFLPEASLIRSSHLLLDTGSRGPQINQLGQCSDPTYYASGNLLRPVETAGWCYREGAKIGELVAADLAGRPSPAMEVTIDHDAAIRFVVPQRISFPLFGGLHDLQIRVVQAASGTMTVSAGGRTLWAKAISVLPERRILIPLAGLKIPAGAEKLLVSLQP